MNSSKKILYLAHSLEVGGAESQFVELASQIKQRGWLPEFYICNQIENKLTQKLKANQIPIHFPKKSSSRGFFGSLVVLGRIVFHLKQHKPQILHTFLPRAHFFSYLASFFMPRMKLVMSRRSLNRYQRKFKFLWIEKRMQKRMDVITANSNAVLAELKLEGVEKEKLKLIYNGLLENNATSEIEVNKELMRKTLGIQSHALVFIVIANLFAYKGHSDLIEAFALIENELPKDWRLLVVGRDSENLLDSLVKQAEEAKLKQNILFLDYQADIHPYTQISDIGILVSHQEGFSNAILECMHAALPMVVSDVGGNREAVLDNQTGYLVEPANPTSISQGLLKMVKNTNRAAMGQLGKERIEELFKMKHCVDEYEKLYHQLIKFPNQS